MARVPGRLAARPAPPGSPRATPPGVCGLDLGESGTALVHIPVGHDPGRPSPLAVVLHGAGAPASDGLELMRWLADAAGLLLVAPASRGRTWDLLDDGYGPDVALLDHALAQVFDRYAVDPSHLAIAGFSDGASYAVSLGTVNGDLFTHVMAFSPGFWDRGEANGSPSFFVSHGTHDPVLPIASASRRIVPMLERAGYEVDYHEFEGGHVVPGDVAAGAVVWFLGNNEDEPG